MRRRGNEGNRSVIEIIGLIHKFLLFIIGPFVILHYPADPEDHIVKAVNKIYGDTEFDAGRYSHTGHTFEVQRIKIYNSSECTGTGRCLHG